MEKIRAVVFIGMNPWHYSAINDSVRFLAAACTKADCHYLDPPLGLRNSLTQPASFSRGFSWRQEVCGSVRVYQSPLGFAPVSFGMRQQADKVTAAQFDALLAQRYGTDWREFTLVYISSWSYTQTYFVKYLQPKNLVFHILDDSFAFPEIKNDPRVLAGNNLFFKHMMRDSNLVVAVSRELTEKYSALYQRDVHLLKNGVNVEHFQGPGESGQPDMAEIKDPVLMYTGSINSWVDLPLLIKLAEDKPDYSLVLIGHYYAGSADEHHWQALLNKSNVYWLNSKPFAMLPGYLHRAAALLLPRTGDEHSLASDPLKLYEYMSTGKPVVSTGLPAIDDFRRFVYVADREGFAAKIDQAMAEHNEVLAGQQIDVIRNHSWPARIDELFSMIK
ncbi:MAG: glycosyltransferase [Peptococcaceae bacterium]|nr:glycosyltransferase [Peptococcaceae bacterium]